MFDSAPDSFMIKTRYVLDTNVLLYDPGALDAYPEGEVIVPISVIEEIDQFKKEMSETGRNARLVSKTMDEYRLAGSLAQGFKLPNGGAVRVFVCNRDESLLPKDLDQRKSGNRVLACALLLREQSEGPLVLVSQDTNIRIKANALGIESLAYEGEGGSTEEIYRGFTTRELDPPEIDRHRRIASLKLAGEFYPNEGLVLQNKEKQDDYLAYRYLHRAGEFRQIPDFNGGVWDVKPRNPQQTLAMEILLDPDVSIVTLMGKAGTGKTLLALAAGLQMMMDENTYTKLLVSRPIFPMGRDIGYLPGTAEEKLAPWMQPIFDNLEFLIDSPVSKHSRIKGYEALIEQGLINIEPLTYIRGRSIPHQFMIVDESQNLTPHEIKTIITRVGVGTKIVLTGDPYQIDNPYVDSLSNGLSHVVERFKHLPLSGHVTLLRGERSPLAEMAANIL
jgi:PhoH-like ATPase